MSPQSGLAKISGDIVLSVKPVNKYFKPKLFKRKGKLHIYFTFPIKRIYSSSKILANKGEVSVPHPIIETNRQKKAPLNLSGARFTTTVFEEQCSQAIHYLVPILSCKNWSTRFQKSKRFFGTLQPCPSSSYRIQITLSLVRLIFL